MENIVYVYKDPSQNYLIVKRTPFSYQISSFDREGYVVDEIIQGIGITCPEWKEIRVCGNYVFAKALEQVYEISDLGQRTF